MHPLLRSLTTCAVLGFGSALLAAEMPPVGIPPGGMSAAPAPVPVRILLLESEPVVASNDRASGAAVPAAGCSTVCSTTCSPLTPVAASVSATVATDRTQELQERLARLEARLARLVGDASTQRAGRVDAKACCPGCCQAQAQAQTQSPAPAAAALPGMPSPQARRMFERFMRQQPAAPQLAPQLDAPRAPARPRNLAWRSDANPGVTPGDQAAQSAPAPRMLLERRAMPGVPALPGAPGRERARQSQERVEEQRMHRAPAAGHAGLMDAVRRALDATELTAAQRRSLEDRLHEQLRAHFQQERQQRARALPGGDTYR